VDGRPSIPEPLATCSVGIHEGCHHGAEHSAPLRGTHVVTAAHSDHQWCQQAHTNGRSAVQCVLVKPVGGVACVGMHPFFSIPGCTSIVPVCHGSSAVSRFCFQDVDIACGVTMHDAYSS
jgi:hypothetical protein